MRISGPGPQQEQLRLQLVKAGDPSSYADALVSQALCAVNSTAPQLNGAFMLQQHSSQAEVSDFVDVQSMLSVPRPEWQRLCHDLHIEVVCAQIVNRAIETLVMAASGDVNALCLGYRKVRLRLSCSAVLNTFDTYELE